MFKKYWIYFKTGLLKSIEFKGLWLSFYFLDVLILIISSLIFGFIDPARSSTYYLIYYLIQLQVGFEIWKMALIKEDIKKGDLLVYLTRPLNYLVFRFFYLLGLDMTRQFFYAVIVALMAYASFYISWVNLAVYFLYLLASLVLEYFFSLSFILWAFFIYEAEEVAKIISNIKWFLMGGILPYTFFPDTFRNIIDYTVFAYIGYDKVKALFEPSSLFTFNFWIGYLINLIIFAIIVIILWKKGLKVFESQGG